VAIDGEIGTVQFSRTWPEPVLITDEAITAPGAIVRLRMDAEGFWNGDHVLLSSPLGLPFDVSGTGYANTPDGHTFWGTAGGPAGPATLHRTDDTGPFWSDDDADPFWEDASTTGLTTQLGAYIHRNDLEQATFYSLEAPAVNGEALGRIPLFPVGFDAMVISVFATAPGYQSDLLQAAASVERPEWRESLLSDLIALPASVKEAAAEADTRGWKVMADLSGWDLETDCGALDQAAIGEAFGSVAVSQLSGAGSFMGEVSNTYAPGITVAAKMLHLQLLTQQGASATVRFLVADGGRGHSNGVCFIKEECLFYEMDVLLTNVRLSTQTGDTKKVRGQFASIGGIRFVVADRSHPLAIASLA